MDKKAQWRDVVVVRLQLKPQTVVVGDGDHLWALRPRDFRWNVVPFQTEQVSSLFNGVQ